MLLSWLGQHKGRYLVATVALAFSDGGQFLTAYLVGRAIDALEAGQATQADLRTFALAIVGTALVIMLARYVWRLMLFGSARRIERDLRQRLHDHLQTLHADFFLKHKVGELMAHATNDISAVQLAAAQGMMAAIDAVLVFVGAAAMMVLTVDARLTLVALAPLLLLTPATYWLGKRLHTRYGLVQAAFGSISDRVQEDLAGVRVVKGYAREAGQRTRFEEANEHYRAVFSRMLRYDTAFDPLIAFLAGLGFTLGLAYGGALVIRGDISLGQYVAFNTYLAMMVWPMLALGWTMNLFQRGLASIARLQQLFETEPGIRDAPGALPLAAPRGHLRVAGLSFRYRPELPPALVDLDLDLAPGRTLGILGRTGSGKSTLVALLLRQFDPPPGTVFLDGVDVTRMRLADLRRAFAVVPQDAFLFSRSIAENIAFDPRPQPYTPDEIERVARLAVVDGDIRGFTAGYDTLLGERGITLSGGQRQRVSMARALIREAPILVLDDALSAVDTATEARILAALAPVMAERTTIIVGHRVSAMRHADEILVLEEGRVVERGGHAALLEASGAYADLHRKQRLALEIEELEQVLEATGSADEVPRPAGFGVSGAAS